MNVFARLRRQLKHLITDLDAVLSHDPAARGRLEAALIYPGVHALWSHRLAHGLWRREYRSAARLVAHTARFITGVEIHPGAKIGRGVFIDHGMGVVIGETAHVGEGCVLFQGAVLGGTSMLRGIRHPQLESHVVVGAHACILGGITVGEGARIGSGSVVIREVPKSATVVGVPGRVVPVRGSRQERFDATLDHASLPDPVAEMLRTLRQENDRLRERLERVERQLDVKPDEATDDEHLIDGHIATPDLPQQHGG